MILIISVFVHFMYVIADDKDVIVFKLHPWVNRGCTSQKTKYIFQVNNEVDILVNSQAKLYNGWCKFEDDERFVIQTLEYIQNEHKGIFQGYNVAEAIEGKFWCCLFYNRGISRNASNAATVLYNDVQYSQKCCNTRVTFIDDVTINFEITSRDKCSTIDGKTEYSLKEKQRLIVKTISKVGAADLSCITEDNKTMLIHNSQTDYTTITAESGNQQATQSAQKELNNAERVGGKWKCYFKIQEYECSYTINIIKETSDPLSGTNMTTVYIAVGVSLAVLLIIAQTWAIFYFRNKAKAAARLERLSTGKTDDRKKDERVYSTTPSLSALKAKQDDRVESEIYETIDTINIDPGLRPPVPLPTETDDDDFYEDPETVKDVFNQGVFLPSTSSTTCNLKPQPPPCSTLPGRKKEKFNEKKVSSDRPPLAVPKIASRPLKLPVKPIPKPAPAHVTNELNTVFKRLNQASSPATATMKLPAKPTLPHHPKPSPSVVKETAPVPVFPSQEKFKPVIQTAKPVRNHKVPVNHSAKRPLPPPAQHSNLVTSPPRPPKPVPIKPESDPADLSDDSEFDEYDVLPQYNIYNR